jgi:redox-sensitive bicupin YhaK (pirin superfamily)
MSNISNIIEERASNIGNFLVGRLLPFVQKKMVGPFIFIDHMGPAELSSNENLDVPPHPHIGLATITYMLEGAIMHRDSLGNELEITPGAVNLMIAGSGVVHSERTPERLRHIPKTIHGLQIWVALPKALEEINPSFTHVEAQSIPKWEHDGINYKLIVGKLNEVESPVPVLSNMYMLEIKNNSSSNKNIDIGDWLYGECGLYILNGTINIDNQDHGEKQLLVAQNPKLCSFTILPNTTLYLFGGEPFEETRHILWNFVHSDKNKIEAAKERWKNQAFPKVPNETEWVPFPERK